MQKSSYRRIINIHSANIIQQPAKTRPLVSTKRTILMVVESRNICKAFFFLIDRWKTIHQRGLKKIN